MEQQNGGKDFPAKDIFLPALNIGALTGTSGVLVGGVAGLFRSSTPALFAIASGIQCFALGSTFWATRRTLLYAWDLGPGPHPSDRLSASAVAGSISGAACAAIFRGRRNIIPGTIMFSLFGYAGQSLYNRLDEQNTEQVRQEENIQVKERKEGFWEKAAGKKWSPLTKLSDEDYEQILRERLLRVEAEIAILDDEVERLKAQEIATSAENGL